MSMTADEAAFEEYYDQLYEEHKTTAIEDFTFSR